MQILEALLLSDWEARAAMRRKKSFGTKPARMIFIQVELPLKMRLICSAIRGLVVDTILTGNGDIYLWPLVVTFCDETDKNAFTDDRDTRSSWEKFFFV